MQDLPFQPIDVAPSTWLDTGTNETAGALYGGKTTPPPPPPPPVDDSIINGTNGDDVLQGGIGDNKIYGGKGEDTVEYHGGFGDYELSFDPNTWQYHLTDKISGRDGSDQLNGIERLQFDGITVLLGTDGSAHLEDGTEVLAPYVPPPPPEGWDGIVGGWDPVFGVLPGEGGGDFVIAVELTEGEPVTAHWVAHTNAADIALNGIATLAVDLPIGDA